VTVVLIFGFGPVSPGLVLTFVIAFAYSGGSKDLKLNFINGFLTGSSPNECRFLRPRALISTVNSLKSILSVNLMY